MHPITRRSAYLLLQLMLLTIPLQVLMADEPARLKAVLFYPAFCAECPAVIDDFLFPLSVTQAERLELFPVDITEPPGDELFKQVLERFAARPDSWNRPTVLVGGLLLHGKSEIIDGLPPLIAGEPTAEFSTWPDLPGLQQMINGDEIDSTTATGNASDPIATSLAWTVMISMLLALSYSLSRLVNKGRALIGSSPVDSWSLPFFALLGLAIGIYLTSVAFTHNEVMCGPIGDCMSVQASPYARLLGIPMSFWGVVFYLGILLLWLIQRFITGNWVQHATLGLLTFSVFGVAFSVYLTSLELFIIHAVCIWCLSSAVLATLIMLIVIIKSTGDNESCSSYAQ